MCVCVCDVEKRATKKSRISKSQYINNNLRSSNGGAEVLGAQKQNSKLNALALPGVRAIILFRISNIVVKTFQNYWMKKERGGGSEILRGKTEVLTGKCLKTI